jgi:hypothetical protein
MTTPLNISPEKDDTRMTPLSEAIDLAHTYARAACHVRDLEEAADDFTRDDFHVLRATPAALFKALMGARKGLVQARTRLDRRLPAEGLELGGGCRVVRVLPSAAPIEDLSR